MNCENCNNTMKLITSQASGNTYYYCPTCGNTQYAEPQPLVGVVAA